MTRQYGDTQADRIARTIVAPNGARVVMPQGTPLRVLVDRALRWAYVDLALDIAAMDREFETLFPPREPRYTTMASVRGRYVEVRG